MPTLREYMQTNSWVALTTGVSVDEALGAFVHVGCDVDLPDVLDQWGRVAHDQHDLTKVVRAKLQVALAGDKVWFPDVPKPYPGQSDHVPLARLPSGRQDEEAVAIRVRGRFVGDGRGVAEIAQAEGIPESMVVQILRAEGLDPTAKWKRPARTCSVQTAAQREAEARRQDAIDRIRQCYAQVGRRPPANLDQRVGP